MKAYRPPFPLIAYDSSIVITKVKKKPRNSGAFALTPKLLGLDEESDELLSLFGISPMILANTIPALSISACRCNFHMLRSNASGKPKRSTSPMPKSRHANTKVKDSREKRASDYSKNSDTSHPLECNRAERNT
jgi:hypothetical protein